MERLKIAVALLIAAAMLLSLTACGDKGPDVTGKYICVGESYGGEYSEPYSESWIELKKGGKGTYFSGFEFNLKWKLDGENFTGTVTFLGMEETMEGTLKDGVMEVSYGDMKLRFLKEGAEAPQNGTAGSETTGGEGTAAPAGLNANATVAGSIADAFSGAVAGGASALKIGLPSTWYGWLYFEDVVGFNPGAEYLDGWGFIDTDNTGKPYFEVFRDGDSENPMLSMYMTIEDNGTCILPDIGNEDAWIFDTYLTPADAEQYQAFLVEDGTLISTFDYVSYTGEYSCTVTMCFREDGTAWDEENDLLPPRYDEYKATLEANNADSEPKPQPAAGGEYSKTTPDADGIVDFDTLKSGFAWLSNATSYEGGYQRPTYEEIAKQLGADGKKTHESSWEQDYHVYEWVTTGGDFLLLSFKVHEDGSETWNSSSWSNSLKD